MNCNKAISCCCSSSSEPACSRYCQRFCAPCNASQSRYWFWLMLSRPVSRMLLAACIGSAFIRSGCTGSGLMNNCGDAHSCASLAVAGGVVIRQSVFCNNACRTFAEKESATSGVCPCSSAIKNCSISWTAGSVVAAVAGLTTCCGVCDGHQDVSPTTAAKPISSHMPYNANRCG